MELKKTFIVFFAYIVVIFGLMLTTSYAWYSFANGSTTFDAVTGNRDRDIVVTFDSSSNISTTTAIPINSSDSSVFPLYADKNTFTVDVTNFANNGKAAIEVKIQDISFTDADGNATDALKDANFKYSFLYNNSEIASGNFEGFTGNELILENNLSITKDSINNFELRLWIEDNGGDQSNMENKTFTGTIAVTVISR